MKMRRLLSATVVVALMLTLCISGYGQTYIRASLPNPSHQPATGYHFQILTPGEVLEAVAQTESSGQQASDARVVAASLRSDRSPKLIKAIRDDAASASFAFDRSINANERIDLRIAFTPKEYWKVYFKDVFQYADGHTERSRIPYAAFFISYEPTKDPDKKKATLTIVNNVASSYGIPKSVINDDTRRPIVFRNARVYINNTLTHYDLAHFDHPDGKKVDLPSAFTLKAGEAQTFDLGLVNAHSYVLTLSEISYEGEQESFPIACSHPDDGTADQQAKVFSPQQ